MNNCGLPGIDRRMKVDDRIEAVVSAAANYPWLGDLTPESILSWVELELGRLCMRPTRRSTATTTAWSGRSVRSFMS